MSMSYDPESLSNTIQQVGSIAVQLSAHNTGFDVQVRLATGFEGWANYFRIKNENGVDLDLGPDFRSIFSRENNTVSGNTSFPNRTFDISMMPLGYNLPGGFNSVKFDLIIIQKDNSATIYDATFEVDVSIKKRCTCDILPSNTPPFQFNEIAKLISENGITHEKYSEFSIKSNVSWELYLTLNQNGSDMDIARPNLYVVKDNSPRLITEADEVIVGSGERGVKSLSLGIRTVADFIHPPQTYTPLLNYRIACGLD